MRKNLLYLIAAFSALLASSLLQAQTVKKIEVEPYLGLSYPIRNINGSAVVEVEGLNMGLEFRYNLPSLPMSIGADLSIASANRALPKPNNGKHFHNTQRMTSLAAVCDWNFRQGRTVALFTGIGTGIAQRETIKSGIDNGIGMCPTLGMYAAPRIGVELWNHLRLTIEAKFTQRDYNVVAFRLGVPIGGGRE